VLIWVKMSYELVPKTSVYGYKSKDKSYSKFDNYNSVCGFKGEYAGEVKDYCF
jgi:hypothetical protein